MNIDVNIFLALAAGIISFLSPCIFPVIPSYLSYIGGLSASDLGIKKGRKGNLLLNSLLFVGGFTFVFMLMGIFFSSVGAALSGITNYINIVAGMVVIFLGFNFIFNFWKILNMEKRFHFKRRPAGKPGSVLLGMAFGAGWTPCIGPILASILLIASSSDSIYKGGVLLLAYSIGLGIPFIGAGLFFTFFKKTMGKINPHLQKIKIGSGVFLIVIGIFIFSGQLTRLNSLVYVFADGLRKWEESNPLTAKLVYGTLFLLPGLTALLVNRSRRKRISRFLLIILLIETIITVFISLGIFDVGGLMQRWLTFRGI